VAQRQWEIRLATPHDTAQIVELIESAYRGDASRVGWTTEADLLGGQRTDRLEIEEILANPRARLILCCAGETLMGCILVRNDEGSAYIGMLAVSPHHQRGQLGRQLLAEAERVAQHEFHAQTVRMTVIVQREDLIRWYVRRGYTVTGRREPFPYDNPRFGLPKRLDLEFAVLERVLETLL
jgi:ribosomal protein S18 acetylase RimI-like enzyme